MQSVQPLASLARKVSDLYRGTFSEIQKKKKKKAQAKKVSLEQEEVTRRASLSLL